MEEYAIDVLPGEVMRWARLDAKRGAPQLWVKASKQYIVETDFDRAACGIGDDEDLALVSVHGLLELSPQHGLGGWTLQLRADDVMGLIPSDAEMTYEDEDDMTAEAFEEQFLIPESGEVEVVVQAEDGAAWMRFQDWFGRQDKAQAASP